MAFKSIAVLLIVLATSCQPAPGTSVAVKANLKTSMQAFLYNAINNDSANLKYRVEDVTYYEDKDKYSCDFKVNMKGKLFDTTGIMKANVSKDFKKVNRLD